MLSTKLNMLTLCSGNLANVTFAPCKWWCQSGKGLESIHALFLLENPVCFFLSFFPLSPATAVFIGRLLRCFFKAKMLTKWSIMLVLCSMLLASIMPKIMPAESAKA